MSMNVDRLSESLADRYKLEREIARGGMATVYLALDQKHQRNVALKVILPDIALSISGQRFLREIEITAHLAHPNVLPLLDSGEAGGFLYHVTPYMEGETLADRLKRERQLPIADAVRIAREVADALDYAHTEGIVHRDVKPENIILSKGHALIGDFGVARAIDVGGGERLTQTGIILGSPAYMSPEQASGERNLDGRSDIYALGCVVYEMLCGEPPLIGRTSMSTIARRLKQTPDSLRVVRDSITPGMDETVLKALSRLPADRFARAQEFGHALAVTISGAAMPTPYAGTVLVPSESADSTERKDQASHAKPSFWEEMKRRKVYSVGVVYLVVALAFVGFVSDTLPNYGVTESGMRLLLTGVIVGFPITLFLAWVFEITSEGIRRTQSIDTRRGRRKE
jgi:serine/threonine-protein kinase